MKLDLRHPRLGTLAFNGSLGGYESDLMPIAALGGHRARFLLEEYERDMAPAEFDAAIEAMLAPRTDLLAQAQPHLLLYREDILKLDEDARAPEVPLTKPDAIWSQVRLGDTLHVSRRARGDTEDGVYVSLECACDWEPEHGLQLAMRAGATISKIGPYDGHVTNADAADGVPPGIIYLAIEH